MGLSGLFMIRGMFRGLSVANVAFMEAVTLVIAFPVAWAISRSQWKKLHQMASKDGLPGGEQNTTRR
jgi:ABC-type spermidine/putrescine transport system permease subunit I